jgi:putative DNA primase/helicase
MTKITAIAPDRSCATPLWQKFLKRITGSDQELITFLQRIAGYSLTGGVSEHAMFFGYGTGANGKSVFTNTIAGILGDYATTAPIETFTASNHDRHPTDLAGLRGARLVTATETEEGRRWAESRLKALTGGDRVSARYMRQDFFEFTPQFKLLISGNHKPGLRSVDEAIRRRINLLPFNVTIPPAERDPDLSVKLNAEAEGILAWMLQGCLDWQRDGLATPEAVRTATDLYLQSEDAIMAYLDDYCERDPTAFESIGALFKGWQSWCDATGEYCVS